MKLIAIIIGLALSVNLKLIAQEIDLLQAMSSAQFKAAGLHKLSPDELQQLNLWLQKKDQQIQHKEQHLIAENFGLNKAAPEPEALVSTVLGEFRGWRGDSVFTLENGQVWQQRGRGSWQVRLTNPQVKISKNVMGFYTLEVLGHQRKTGVKRLR